MCLKINFGSCFFNAVSELKIFNTIGKSDINGDINATMTILKSKFFDSIFAVFKNEHFISGIYTQIHKILFILCLFEL